MGMGRTRKPKVLAVDFNKKLDIDMEWCEACECEISKNPKSLAQHYNSESQHKRKEKLLLLSSFFAKHGLDFFPGGTTYYCQICSMSLPNNVNDLQFHLEKYANKHQVDIQVKNIPFPTTGNEVFLKKSMKLVDFASTNDALNAQLVELERVASPITMMESGPIPSFIFDLRRDVFTPTELDVITEVVSYLEKYRKNFLRSEARGSTRMCLWGMRSAYGDTGWYVQDRHSCYGLSEDLATYVCGILKISYGKIFEHLESIPIAEGFLGNDARVGGGPFSSFATSRDFNNRPHKDQDDYGYGFIFWLHEGTVPKGVEPALFAFPEVGVSFVPQHGDVVCFQPGQYLHCTRRFMKSNLLGVAFFQKCSLYRQLGELTHPEGSGRVVFRSKNGKKNIVETRVGFLKKKEKYEQYREESTLCLSDFMVCQ